MKFDLNYFNSRLEYDPKSGILYWKKGKRIGKRVGCIGVEGYVQFKSDKKQFKAHRVVWLMSKGVWPKKGIDHINHNCADNRIENLREATIEQNGHNRKLQKNNTSGFSGVSPDKRTGKWRVDIRINKKIKCLGFFVNVNDAKMVRLCAEKKYYGDFAYNKNIIKN